MCPDMVVTTDARSCVSVRRVNQPQLIMPDGKKVEVTFTLNPKDEIKGKGAKAVVFTTNGNYTLPDGVAPVSSIGDIRGDFTKTTKYGGIHDVNMQIKVPRGLDDQSVSVQMFGSPNPPPPEVLCPCPTPLNSEGDCDGTLTKIKLYPSDNSTTFVEGCIPSPYWDGAKGELMISHCWRASCLENPPFFTPTAAKPNSPFYRKDYDIEMLLTDKYNIAAVPSGKHELSFFKPKVVDMFVQFQYVDRARPTETAQFSSRDGQVQSITVPAGGIAKMGLRMKVPFNPIYDINSASANLNTDPSRLIPPPPPPLAITNYSYTINRNAQVLRSTVLIDDLLNVTTAASNGSDAASGAFNFTQVKSTFARDFSNDIDMSMSGYIMSQDISFPDYGLVQSCTSADVQAVINKIAAKYGVSPDSIAASCQYDYKKPDAVTTVTAAHRRRRGRSLQQTTVTTPAVCYPRISITVSMPLGVPMDGNVTKALAAATTAADAVYDAVGTDACYVPTGAESRVGTVVAFTTTNSKATCEYITQAFANAGNFTADMIRTYNCGEENPKKPYPPGLIGESLEALPCACASPCLCLLFAFPANSNAAPHPCLCLSCALCSSLVRARCPRCCGHWRGHLPGRVLAQAPCRQPAVRQPGGRHQRWPTEGCTVALVSCHGRQRLQVLDEGCGGG